MTKQVRTLDQDDIRLLDSLKERIQPLVEMLGYDIAQVLAQNGIPAEEAVKIAQLAFEGSVQEIFPEGYRRLLETSLLCEEDLDRKAYMDYFGEENAHAFDMLIEYSVRVQRKEQTDFLAKELGKEEEQSWTFDDAIVELIQQLKGGKWAEGSNERDDLLYELTNLMSSYRRALLNPLESTMIQQFRETCIRESNESAEEARQEREAKEGIQELPKGRSGRS